jgi:hypothetical protein
MPVHQAGVVRCAPSAWARRACCPASGAGIFGAEVARLADYATLAAEAAFIAAHRAQEEAAAEECEPLVEGDDVVAAERAAGVKW